MASRQFPEKIYRKLPPIIAEVTEPFEGRNKDVILLSAITVLSACFPRVKSYYDDEEFYPHLYAMIIAPPASGKGIMMKSKRLIQPIDNYIKQKSLGPDLSMKDVTNEPDSNEDDKKKKQENKQSTLTIIPANSSSTELIRYMDINPHGVLMIESEMDTMGNVINKDWGNYSDLLRKAFHHEAISESRKIDSKYVHIEYPKLSVLMSGTPDQVHGIANTRENGLLSRFLIYSYDEITPFKDVFSKEPGKKNQIFDQQGRVVLEIFQKLELLEKEIIFSLLPNQQRRFLEFFQKHQDVIVIEEPLSFISNLRRLGVIVFRICLVLTISRQGKLITENCKDGIITCENRDFLVAMQIIDTLIEHSLFSFKSFPNKGMSELDMQLLDGLRSDKVFTRLEFVEAGTKLGLGERTLADKLTQWTRLKLIKKVKHGKYQKI